MTNLAVSFSPRTEQGTRRYSARVKQTLLAITGVLSLLAVGFAANGIVRAVTADSNAKRIAVVNEATDLLLDAAGAWAVERGLTTGAIQDRAAASPDVLAQIRQRRDQADAALASALKVIETVGDFADKDRLVADAKSAHATLSGLRQGGDVALGQPLDRPDPATAQRIGPAVTDLIMKTAQLRRATGRVAADLEGLVGSLAGIKHAAWVAAEYAGRERAAIAGIIRTTGQIDPTQAKNLSDFRARLETGWSDVRALANGASTPAAIKAAAADAERAYFADFEKTREAVYQAATAGKPLPLTGEQWFSAATAGIAALLKVGEVAGVETKNYASANASAAEDTTMAMGALMVVTLALATFAFWMTTTRVTRPLAAMTESMGKLAAGDKGIEVPGMQRTDEIGAMAAAVQVFKENMLKNIEMEAEKERQRVAEAERERQAQAEKDKQQEAEAERQKRIAALIANFDATASKALKVVASAATELQATAQSMSATAEETARQATSVAAASEQASTNVQTVAAATEELAASVQEIGRQVTQSSKIAQQAVADSARTNEKVRSLADSANKIGDVVNLINDIASQTNLLALNATIEAARAGEAGKGFAVVASEVKTLANQTAKATEEISGQIASVQSATTEAVDAIKVIGATIAEINEIASSIASAVEQQAAATQDIAGNVQQAAQGTQEVSSNISGVTQAAGETGTAASQVLSAAGSLSQEAEALSREAQEFFTKIKAA